MTQLCPCHSERPFTHCCQPIHEGKERPSPVQLMRARYAAYALGQVRFVIQTERLDPPLTPQALATHRRSLKQFCQTTQFLGLQILNEAMLDDQHATVTFRATLLQNGQYTSYTEQSLFEQQQGRWFYIRALEQR